MIARETIKKAGLKKSGIIRTTIKEILESLLIVRFRLSLTNMMDRVKAIMDATLKRDWARPLI